ncbi:uncharacterized protein A4U43_C01F30430 [Asparagus officinalis]|uniref:Uncharacterized protein n=1 Tax=Asparagus officinalis TaxID=4686 RepID=A0A5P1FTY7_ASPOF|nr:uncharacterized protein A4U43_C01F30430 [Asparagus officinalis]
MTFSSSSSQSLSLNCNNSGEITETQKEISVEMTVDGTHHAALASGLVDELVGEALVWSSLHGLVVGDRSGSHVESSKNLRFLQLQMDSGVL